MKDYKANDYKIIETTDMNIDGLIQRLCLVEYANGHVGLVWLSSVKVMRE